MILCDTGPIVALIDEFDARHAECEILLLTITPPLVITWSCVAEAMYLVGRRSGFNGQTALWNLLENPAVAIHQHRPNELIRMRELMAKYHDLPMDLADASLVAAAESLSLTRIFTLDSDFRIYRLGDGRAFEIVP